MVEVLTENRTASCLREASPVVDGIEDTLAEIIRQGRHESPPEQPTI
jgi:hypothetical protein